YASALSLGIRAGRAGHYAGCRVAGQTESCIEPCREAPRRPDADPRRVPGQALMHEPCTGERARMAAYAALHSRCGQNFHCLSSFSEIVTWTITSAKSCFIGNPLICLDLSPSRQLQGSAALS